jgi:hypothetical protein
VGLIIAGVFTADPGAGFPPGAPSGAPTISWHGLLHELGFLLTFVAAIFVRNLASRPEHTKRRSTPSMPPPRPTCRSIGPTCDASKS